MKSILEVQATLATAMQAGLIAYNRFKHLFTMQDAIHDIQMALYWMKSADIAGMSESDLATDINGIAVRPAVESPKLPTLLGVPDYLGYINAALVHAIEDLKPIKEQLGYTQEGQYMLDHAYDRLQEAIFNIRIAGGHYEQVNGVRDGKSA